jgi:Ca2+-binding EF-hand superfamily protein
VDPSQRLSANAALDHPWIKKLNVESNGCTGLSTCIAQYSAVSEEMTQVMELLRQYGSTSEFRRCCLQALAWSCSNEDQAKVRDQFLTLNCSLKGSFTFEELGNAMFNHFPEMERTEFAKIWDALDHNHDHTIHYSDFLAAMMGSQFLPFTKDMMAIAFRRFDVDKSGFITAGDLKSSAGLFEARIAEGIFKEVVGSSGSISFEQFSFYLDPSPYTICSLDAKPSPQEATLATTGLMQKFSGHLVLRVFLESISAFV